MPITTRRMTQELIKLAKRPNAMEVKAKARLVSLLKAQLKGMEAKIEIAQLKKEQLEAKLLEAEKAKAQVEKARRILRD